LPADNPLLQYQTQIIGKQIQFNSPYTLVMNAYPLNTQNVKQYRINVVPSNFFIKQNKNTQFNFIFINFF